MIDALADLALATVRLHASGVPCGFALAGGVCEVWYEDENGVRDLRRITLDTVVSAGLLECRALTFANVITQRKLAAMKDG